MYPFEVFTDPQRLHAAVVHLPVAMALLGIPLVYLTAISQSDKETLRWLTLGWYALLIPLALLGQWTGERAYDEAPTSTLPKAVMDQVLRHEEMAEYIWMFAAATAVLVAVSTLNIRWFRMIVMSLAMVSSLATGVWVSVTGHLGGDLVYTHGVGTPGVILTQPAETPPAVTPPAPAPPTEPAESAPSPAPEAEAAPVPVPAPSAPPAPEPIAPEFVPPAAPPTEAAPPVLPDGPAAPPTDVQAPTPDGFSPAVRPIVPEEAAKVSYVRDVRPIIEARCLNCHEDDPEGGLSLASVPDMLKPGLKSGPGVIPFKPDESPVVQYIRGVRQPQMPRRKPPLSEDELHVIRMWIKAGAVDDSQAAPPVEEAAPPAPPPAEPAPAPSRNALEAGHGAGSLLVASQG